MWSSAVCDVCLQAIGLFLLRTWLALSRRQLCVFCCAYTYIYMLDNAYSYIFSPKTVPTLFGPKTHTIFTDTQLVLASLPNLSLTEREREGERERERALAIQRSIRNGGKYFSHPPTSNGIHSRNKREQRSKLLPLQTP